MEQTQKEAKRTPAIVLAEIEAKLATIDGISMSDAFALGGLVREYGHATAGETAGSFVASLMGTMTKRDAGKSPWEI